MKECIEYFDSLIFKRLPVQVAVAGGALRDYFSGMRTGDFNNVNIYVDSNKKLDTMYRFLDRNAVRKRDTDYATRYYFNDLKLDLVHGQIYKELEDIIKEFDFTACCCAVDNTRIVKHDNFLEDVENRVIRINENAINKLKKNAAILQRLQKYIKKGYSASDDTLFQIATIIKGTTKKDLKIKDKGYNRFNLERPMAARPAPRRQVAFDEDAVPRFVEVQPIIEPVPQGGNHWIVEGADAGEWLNERQVQRDQPEVAHENPVVERVLNAARRVLDVQVNENDADDVRDMLNEVMFDDQHNNDDVE